MLTTGIQYLDGALARDDALAIGDRIWEAYAARGVHRDDVSTWPGPGLQVKLQQLRKRGVFAPFDNDVVRAAIAAVLGDDFHTPDPWGGSLISFPQPGPWHLPRGMWHCDLPARGNPDRIGALRMFGFVNDVGPQGGGTLVIEGSHELMRRLVAESPGHDAGVSGKAKKELFRRHPWLRQPTLEPTTIDGVDVRVRELTGKAGDIVFMAPWTLHNTNMNCAATPRFMVTHTAFAASVSTYGARSE